jgi:hypothetical protein
VEIFAIEESEGANIYSYKHFKDKRLQTFFSSQLFEDLVMLSKNEIIIDELKIN